MLDDKTFRDKYTGFSFLVNPEPLLRDRSNVDADVGQYVYLASARNYFDYQFLKETRLPIYFCEVPLAKLTTNKLLKLEKDFIRFKYEENTNGN